MLLKRKQLRHFEFWETSSVLLKKDKTSFKRYKIREMFERVVFSAKDMPGCTLYM